MSFPHLSVEDSVIGSPAANDFAHSAMHQADRLSGTECRFECRTSSGSSSAPVDVLWHAMKKVGMHRATALPIAFGEATELPVAVNSSVARR